MCVFHGRGNLRMTHELLDSDEIDPEANKASGESMEKIVEAAAWNPGSPQREKRGGELEQRQQRDS